MTTHQDVVTAAGFVGPLTGDVVGNVTGEQTRALGTDYSADGAIALTPGIKTISKGSAAAMTLAAPGAAMVGKTITILSTTAFAHVVTATGCTGGTTLTFANVAGKNITLYARSATVWDVLANVGITQS